MEVRLKTPEKFHFPAFETLQWYAAKHFTQLIKDANQEHKSVNVRLLKGLKYLHVLLKKWRNSKEVLKHIYLHIQFVDINKPHK